jgi:hypothetical protein
MTSPRTATLALAGVLATAGCATVATGTTHTVAIVTDPPAARCEVARSGLMVGVVETTPGSVTISKEPHALTVTCRKADHEDGRGFVYATPEGMTYGNILIGGAIGTAIDARSGALNKYGALPTITLVPTRFASPAARDAYFDTMTAHARASAETDLAALRPGAGCQDNVLESCETKRQRRTAQRDATLDQIELKRRAARVDAN